MLERFRSMLAPPTFQEEEKTRKAQILNTVLWFLIATLGLVLLIMPFTPFVLRGILAVGSLLLITVVSLVALRAGHVEGVTRFVLFFLWSAVTILVALSGGIVNPEVAGFIIVISTAGLLSGIQASLAFAGLSLLSAVGIYALDSQGLLVTVLHIDSFVAMLVVTTNVVLMSGLLYLALSSLDRALKRADAYARELEGERATLEQRVGERTASAEAARQEAETARREAEAARREAEAEKETVQAINALDDVLRGEQDVAQLADNTVRYLCRHLGAQSGVLFVLNAGSDRLELAGSYARAGDGRLPTQFKLGEGLVGQAAMEKRLITLTNIPAGELTIVSALGQQAPRSILILPLIYEKQIAGVIELGTLSEFSAVQIDFLRRAANNVSIAFHTAQTRMRMNELLRETQQQAEELQAQEEELRAINEELLAQAESLQQQGQLRGSTGKERTR